VVVVAGVEVEPIGLTEAEVEPIGVTEAEVEVTAVEVGMDILKWVQAFSNFLNGKFFCEIFLVTFSPI